MTFVIVRDIYKKVNSVFDKSRGGLGLNEMLSANEGDRRSARKGLMCSGVHHISVFLYRSILFILNFLFDSSSVANTSSKSEARRRLCVLGGSGEKCCRVPKNVYTRVGKFGNVALRNSITFSSGLTSLVWT